MTAQFTARRSGPLRTLRIYRRSLGAHLRSVLEYEADFWILMVAGIFQQVLNLIFLTAIFGQVQALNGWSYEECVLIAGLCGFVGGMGPLFFEGAWRIAWKINHGGLDYPLVRPAPVPAQVISGAIGLHGAGDLLASGAIIGWALSRLPIDWSPWTVLLSLIILLSAIAVLGAIVVAANAASFWIPGPHPFFAVSLLNTGDMAKYPLSIFSRAVQGLLVLATPFAFIGFFPAAWLLDKEHGWIGLLTPLVAIVWVLIARHVFRRGMLRYESAGH
jgi:ABC-2 type transport system permease protein